MPALFLFWECLMAIELFQCFNTTFLISPEMRHLVTAVIWSLMLRVLLSPHFSFISNHLVNLVPRKAYCTKSTLIHAQNNLSWVTFGLPHLKTSLLWGAHVYNHLRPMSNEKEGSNVLNRRFAEGMLLIASLVSLVLLYWEAQWQVLGFSNGSQGDHVCKLSSPSPLAQIPLPLRF